MNVEVIDQTRILTKQPLGFRDNFPTSPCLCRVVLFLLPFFFTPKTRVTGSDVLRVPVDFFLPRRKTNEPEGVDPTKPPWGPAVQC